MKGYRVAVVNPLSPFGQKIRRLLEEQALPTIELKLFDGEPGGGSTLTQFEDEVLITQPLDRDLFPSLDLMFVGEGTDPGVLAEAASASRQGVLTFLAGTNELAAPVAASGLNEKFLPADVRLVALPSAASILVAKVLDGLGESFEVAQARATVMLPASELGEAAVRELHEQVVQILNFGSPPTEVLGEQLAFNLLLPRAKTTEGLLESSIAKEVAELTGLDADRVSIALVRAPIFHSYALSLWVQLGEEPTLESLVTALGERQGIDASEALDPASVASPIRVAGSDRVQVSRARADRACRGAFWLWVCADSMAVDPVANSLALARRLLERDGTER